MTQTGLIDITDDPRHTSVPADPALESGPAASDTAASDTAASGTATPDVTTSDNATALPRRRALGFVLGASAVTVLLMAASAPSPFYPRLQHQLGISPVGITMVFAVYAVALLVALLTVGSLSDNVGRRPVIAVGFALMAVSMLLFWNADSTAMLFAARAVQGIASGILISALSAMVTDFAPPTHPRLAPLFNSIAPMAGLALGSLFAGLAMTWSPVAMAVVFVSLAAAYVVIAVTVWMLPETSARTAGWARALRPRAVIPPTARRLFLLSVPVIIAGWATGGLFFSLGPDIIIADLDLSGHLVQALTIGILPAAGAVAVAVLHGRSPRTATLFGSAALAVGTALTLVALGVGSFWGYLAAVAVTGTGFGSAFMGVVGSLTPTVAVHQRAELFAAIYTVSYLAFGVPTVIAGALVSALSLPVTAVAYGVFVVISAGAAFIVRVREGA